MKSTLRAVREELATALAGLEGWKIYSTAPAAPELPCIIIRHPDRIAYNRTVAGHSELSFTIGAFVSMNEIDTAQEQIEALAEGALADALHFYSPTTFRALDVESAEGFRPDNLGDASVLAIDFVLTLIA